MKIIYKSLFFVILLLMTYSISAQILSPVKWNFSVKKVSNTESELVFTAAIDRGWHLYSQDIPEGGPIPTTFHIEKGMGFFLVGKVTEPRPVEVFDKQFEMKVKYFSNLVEFTQKVRVISVKPVEVKGYVEFMCCNDEQCLPPNEVNFTFSLSPSK